MNPGVHGMSLTLGKLGARFRRRLKLMRDESQIMIDNFILIASLVLENGGDVSFEWPAF